MLAAPITRKQYMDMLDYISTGLKTRGNSRDFRYTGEWAQQAKIPEDELMTFLKEECIQSDFWLCMRCPYELFGQTNERLAWMPIEHKHLRELKQWLRDELAKHGCKCELDLTKAWLEKKGLPVYSTMMALLLQGGGCDCEVLMNVESAKIYPGLGAPRTVEEKFLYDVPDPDLAPAPELLPNAAPTEKNLKARDQEINLLLDNVPDRRMLN